VTNKDEENVLDKTTSCWYDEEDQYLLVDKEE